ncbi:alpha/beta hydrolase [Rubritalea tangerina]|uniref:Alpha/beta hydrolase n=2 Tax=Rubritalea tangerina TaxID=430798 RepID=A0ABW4ZCV2_9BACT
MYERVKVTPDHPDLIAQPSDFVGSDVDEKPPEPIMSWVGDSAGHEFVKDPDEEEKYLIFVHGWRMTYAGSQKYAETMFKRLWHGGYKGRYSFVRWPTYSEDTHAVTDALFTYNNSDYRAWKSGRSLAEYVASLPPSYTVNVTAHSMGNIVVGAAIREGMRVVNYGLLNAAVPAMCYEDNSALYINVRETPDGDDDPVTSELGFGDKLRFTHGANLVNFFLRNDEALEAWETNNSIFKPQRYGATRLTGYYYDRSQAQGMRLGINFWSSRDRFLRAFHEAAALATASRTRTVGAEGRTGGAVNESVDMGTLYGFGSTHSAQWKWRCQYTDDFYEGLIEKLKL